MSVFDLLFLLLLLSGTIAALVAAVAALRGRTAYARGLLQCLVLAAVAYLAVVYAVALLSPARHLTLGEDLCSDDWCIAVLSVRPAADAAPHAVDVTFQISSRAGRVSQRERNVLVYLRDTEGRRVPAEAGPADAPFDTLLTPHEVIQTHRRFTLAPGAAGRELVITRSGFPFPGAFIIGEATGVIHPTVLPL
ncbi:MAG TPA: hypothetical protein VMG41_15525 [Gemmatimonadales bacterium]|nr:hypothetical protein [Gemmatimonadales bacterium]